MPAGRRAINPIAPAGMYSASCRWLAFRKDGRIGNCVTIKCAVEQACPYRLLNVQGVCQPLRWPFKGDGVAKIAIEAGQVRMLDEYHLYQKAQVRSRDNTAGRSVTYSGRI